MAPAWWRGRGETRAIIKYLIRRRIAGATFRAQASHLLNRVGKFFGADGPAEDGNAPRPGFRHREEADRGYDTFDDAYTRFAGRGAWSQGFDPSSFRCLMDLIYRSSSSFSFSLFSRCFSSARSRMPSVLSWCLFCS